MNTATEYKPRFSAAYLLLLDTLRDGMRHSNFGFNRRLAIDQLEAHLAILRALKTGGALSAEFLLFGGDDLREIWKTTDSLSRPERRTKKECEVLAELERFIQELAPKIPVSAGDSI